MAKILFIEDEKWGVNPYFKKLNAHGIECKLATDGNQAMELLKSNTYDLISMDLMFQPDEQAGESVSPIHAGLNLLSRIRSGKIDKCAPNIPVIISTATMSPDMEQEIRALGVSAYLKKPVELRIVIETILSLCP